MGEKVEGFSVTDSEFPGRERQLKRWSGKFQLQQRMLAKFGQRVLVASQHSLESASDFIQVDDKVMIKSAIHFSISCYLRFQHLYYLSFFQRSIYLSIIYSVSLSFARIFIIYNQIIHVTRFGTSDLAPYYVLQNLQQSVMKSHY